MEHRKRLRKVLSLILAVSVVLTTNVPVFADELAGTGATDDFILAENGSEELGGGEIGAEEPAEILIQEDAQEPETLSASADPAVSTVPDEDDGGVLPEDGEDYEITLMSADDVLNTQEAGQVFAEMQIGEADPVQYYDQVAFITALSDASGNIRIKLLADVEVQGYVPVAEGQDVTFDLNGKTLSTITKPGDSERHYYVIQNYGTLTIKDTSNDGTGTIRARGIENKGNGHLTVESGKIVAIDQNGGAAIWNEAEVVINGGVFEAEHVGTASDQVGIGCLNNSGKATITGGTFTDVNKRTYAIISTGEIEITPAEGKAVIVHGAHGGLAIDSGTAVVNGGSYSSDDYYGLYVSNDGEGENPQTAKVTVNGGTFSGKAYSVWIGSDYNSPVNSTIVIQGGTFTKPLNAQEVASEGAITVFGGTFSEKVPEEYCAEGYIMQENADGSYSAVKGTYAASVKDSEGKMQEYETLSEAVSALQANGTLTLLSDVGNEDYANAIRISLPSGAVLDGNGKTISGNVAVYVNAEGGTVKNVCLKNIHNNANQLSAVYASGLTGTLKITGCEFDTCDWDAIQTTPDAGAVISITGNTFRNTGEQGINTRRYVHVESKKDKNFSVTVTSNKFYDGNKLQETALEVYYPSAENSVTVNKNYFADPMGACIILKYSTNRFDLALPFADETLANEVWPEASITRSGNCYYYFNLKDAIGAAATGNTITLRGNVDRSDEAPITIDNGKSLTFNLNGKTWKGDINNNGTLTIAGASGSVTGAITNNGTLTLSDNAAAGYSVTNNGTLNITGGATYDLSKIANGDNGSTVITGGIFTTEPDDSMLAEWYIANLLDDGSDCYKVAKMTLDQAREAGMVASSVASGGTYYKTVSEAVAANNNSAYLQKDVDEDIVATRISTKYYGKIYANGHKLTGGLDIKSEYTGTQTKYFCLYADKGGSIELDSAKFNGDLRAYDGTVVLDYAEAPSMTVATYNTAAKLTLKDALVTGTVDVVASGALNIMGGKYGALQTHVYYKPGEIEPAYTSVLNVTGGTFNSDMVTVAYTNHMLESGATSEQVPLSNYIPEGYEVVQNSDNTYTVRAKAVASIGEQMYASLEEAVEAVQSGETIKLLEDIADTQKISITASANVTIDLNNHNIGFKTNAYFYVSGGSLTLTGEGKVYEQAPNYGPIVVKGATADTADYSVVSVGEKVTLEGWAGIFIDKVTGGHGYGINVTVDGTLKSVKDTSGAIGSGIYINGQIKDIEGNIPKITLGATSQITSEGSGIYAAGYAVWNLAGDVTGNGGEALSIKSGTFNITGGTYTAKGAFADPAEAQGSGSEATGAALSVTSNDGYAKKVDVNVTGGTFVSENGYAVYEGIAKKNDGSSAAESSYASLTISGGTFTGNSERGAVNITTAENKNVISGGTFSSDVTEYCVVGKEAVPNGTDGTYKIGTAKYDVMLYSSLVGGQVTGIANLTGGGTDITYNEPVTVTAPRVDNYQFVGWYNVTGVDTTGDVTTVTYDESQAVGTGPAYTFNIKQDTTLVAVYKAVKKVTLDVSATDFNVNGDAQQGSSYHNQFDIGTEITLEYTGSDTFHYWKNGSDKIVSTSNPYTFTIVSDTKIRVLTTKAGSETDVKSAYVEFVSAYDQVLQTGTWFSNKTENAYSLPAGPSKFGGTFLYWSLDGTTEATVASILEKVAEGTETCITVRPVYKLTGESYTVTVIYPDEVLQNDIYSKAEGEGLTVTAKDIKGKVFSHWSDKEDGSTVLSYSQEYFMVVGKNILLYAIYSDAAVEKQPIITITNAYSSTVDGVNKVSFEATRDIPEGYTLIEHGIVYGISADFGGDTGIDKLVVDGQNVRKLISKDGSVKGVYTAHIAVGSSTNTIVYARGYMTLRDSQSNITTYYTDITRGSFVTLGQ